jgi:hypothetical protein
MYEIVEVLEYLPATAVLGPRQQEKNYVSQTDFAKI